MELKQDRDCSGLLLGRLVVPAILWLVLLAAPSHATTWLGGDGQWTWTTFWEGMRDPDTGDDVWIVDTIFWGPKTLIYRNPYADHTPALNRLVINSNWGIPTTVVQDLDELQVFREEVGANGKGQYRQFGGVHTVLETLSLGSQTGGWGGYALSGGELNVNWTTYIGRRGAGDFLQEGGRHTVGEALHLGWSADAQGTYTLKGEDLGVELDVHGSEYVGYDGTGDFSQQGGQHTVDGTLYLGYSPGAKGTYAFGAGNLDTAQTVVGYRGKASFYQDAGAYHTTDTLTVGYREDSDGSYQLQDGRLNTQTTTIGYHGRGLFEQADGVHNVAGNMYVGRQFGADGQYGMTGGSNRIENSLYIGYLEGALGRYVNSSGSLATYDTYVGYEGRGSLSLGKGATHTVGRNLYIGYGAGSEGSYSMGNGVLRTDNTFVGVEGYGSFSQGGGSHLVENQLYINGRNLETTMDYSLSGGLLSVKDEVIGMERGARFYQRGDSIHEVRGSLWIGRTGSSLYQFYGGELSAMNEYLGLAEGDAQFEHGHGTHTVQSSFYLGHSGTAQYRLGMDLSNPGSLTLTVQAEFIGFAPGSDGVFIQRDGEHLVRGALTLGAQRDQELGAAHGSYDLQDGSLAVSNDLFIGDEGVGEFAQRGGTNTAANMYLGFNPSGVGTYELSGTGVLKADMETVGVRGSGEFTQQTGTNTTDSLFVGAWEGSGTYEMSGGQLNVADTLEIGANGRMTVYDGAVKTGKLNLSDGGAFDFQGGTLMAGSIEGDLVNAGGTLSPGGSPGMLTVTGSYAQQLDATLLMELGGLTRGDEYAGSMSLYDSLLVSDTLELAGTLDVVWWDGFVASEGDVFDLLDWGTLVGQFDTISMPDLGTGLFWNTGNLYVDGSLSVVSSFGPGPDPEPASVPVPGAILLCGAGLLGVRVIRRRLT